MKLGLVLAGPLATPLPSTRVAILNILPLLQAAGVHTETLHAPRTSNETPELVLSADDIAMRGIDVVVFQKVYGPSAVALARALQVRGIPTIFLVCDRVVPEMAEVTSATVCVTRHLANLYPAALMHKMHVVHDGIERPDLHKTGWRSDSGSALHPLRAVLVASSRLDELPVLQAPPPWLHVHIVGLYPPRWAWAERLREHWRAWQCRPERRRRQLSLALNPRITVHAWHPDGVYEHLLRADIGIIPIDRNPPVLAGSPAPAWSVKSENRLTLKMSIGLPVVATPIPAYEPIVDQGRNAYLASTRRDWMNALEQLRDPAHRIALGQAARLATVQAFSMQRQADLLLTLLHHLSSNRRIQ